MKRPKVDLVTWAGELEQDDSPTTISELGEFLEACGYKAVDYPDLWQRVYHHPQWQLWTFDTRGAYVPRGYIRKVAAYVKSKLV